MSKYDPKKRKQTRNTKAYNSNTFLNSREARAIRIQCEMIEPAVRLSRLGIDHMITFFGSARSGPDTEDYKNAYMLAYKLGDICGCDMGISSGGGPGIMEAVNRGAKDSGSKSIGMGISLPFEQSNNEFISKDLDFEFHYFFTRKYWCVYLSKAFVVMPGGVGTMDELFEVLTLIQTKKINNDKPIVLFDSEFWNNTINFKTMVDRGTISEEDLDLFMITDSVDEAVNYIQSKMNLDPRLNSSKYSI
jgi:uncharacterized protein (TIGR00730 family)